MGHAATPFTEESVTLGASEPKLFSMTSRVFVQKLLGAKFQVALRAARD